MRVSSQSSSMSAAAVAAASLCAAASLFGSVAAQDRTTEAGEAQIKDGTAECKPYGYAPVSNAVSQFPVYDNTVPSNATAYILPNDSEAQALWAQIKPSVPSDIQVKGTPAGTNLPTNPSNDPDCWWTQGGCTTPKHPNIPADIVDVPEPNSFGIGFDDGPSCSHNVFYDFLKNANQKATMFYIGKYVLYFPLEAQRGVVDGHEICVHTWSHPHMTGLKSEDAFAELYYARKAIKLVTGVTPTCWRPPYGDVDDRIRAIAHGLGLRNIIWQYDSNDWKNGTTDPTTGQVITPATVDANYQAVLTAAQNGTFNQRGTIMLTHELNNFTMGEMIKFYPQLKSAFKYLVPVGVGYNITQPYLETNYSLPTFSTYISGQTSTTGAAPGAVGNSTAGVSAGSDGKLTPNSNSGNGQTNSSSGGASTGSHSGAAPSALTTLSSLSMLGVAAVAAFLGSL